MLINEDQKPGRRSQPAIAVSAAEFVERHDLSLETFFHIAGNAMFLLPKVLRIGGALKFSDKAGARGESLNPDSPAYRLMNDADGEPFKTVTEFCSQFSLDADSILAYAMDKTLPRARWSSRAPRDVLVVSSEAIADWETTCMGKAIRNKSGGPSNAQ